VTDDLNAIASGRIAIGIDVGGSGIKAAVVEVESGRFRSDRLRVATPIPATPEAVIASIGRIVRRLARSSGLGTTTPVGVGLPGVTMDNTLKTSSNIDPAWIGFPVVERLRKATGRPVTIVNDADAAGIAEIRFGIGRDRTGVVIFLTLGTGVGSGVFVDGKLYDVPQTVEAAVRQLTKAGARFTTVHGTGPLLEAACRARDEAGGDLRILAVTVLTSLDKDDLIELGYGSDVEVEPLVVARAGHALKVGCDGVIASGREAAALRDAHGDGFLIVSPGIRPVHRDDDQKRVVTPEAAFRAGVDHIVVGRPIRDAPDPCAAAEEIQATIGALFVDHSA